MDESHNEIQPEPDHTATKTSEMPAASSPSDVSGESPRRWRKAGIGVAMAALAVVSGLIGALAAGAVDDDDGADDGVVPVAQGSLDTSSDDAGSESASGSNGQIDESLSQAASEVLPSVVSIGADGARGAGQGSGVIISEDGLVLTNNHVAAIADGRSGQLSVTLADGTTTAAEIVGRDPLTDLAVVQLDEENLGDLTPASLGSSADLVVGDTVLAVGSPLGLEGSVTSGIVSALNRPITLSGAPTLRGEPSPAAVIDAIQTDAAVNPGNSGGPLVNADGEVVGINTAIASLAGASGGPSGSIGLGFAIPIDEAQRIVDQLVEEGEVTHAYMGVQLADQAPVRQGRGEEGAQGAVIVAVEPDGPADDAGLREGDIVTAVDGEAVEDAAALTAAVRSHAPGDEINVTVDRDGEEQTFTLTLASLAE
jgi:putative serine protease PepD